MTGVLSLDEVQSSGNDAGSNDSETNDGGASADTDALKQACEAIGADYENASSYVSEHGKEDDLTEFAQRLASDAELQAVQEKYRRFNDIHRIIRKYLRNADADFTAYTGAFYGDSSSPDEGTYNFVQQESREVDGNLMFYRALFPSPDAEFWDNDPVLWHEFDSTGYSDGMQDSHIYVTQEFVSEYSGVNSLEVQGDSKPVPPSNDMLNGDDSGSPASETSDSPFDPNSFTIPDLEEKLDNRDLSVDELESLLAEEKANAERKGAKNAIRDAIDAAEQTASNGGDSDDSDSSPAKTAGEMTGEGNPVPPEKVKELMADGWEKDEIIALYG